MKVAYGPARGQRAYVYESATPGSPLVVLVHGGGFTGGSADSSGVPAEARWLQGHGVTVVNVDYRLVSPGGGSLYQEVGDVIDATHWAQAHALELHADPSNLTLFGGSAGGTLVALASTTVEPRHVVDISGINNIASEVAAVAAKTVAAWYLLKQPLEQALACPVLSACSVAQMSQASPVTAPTNGPTWFLGTSAKDPLVPATQARQMANAVSSHGGQARLATVSGSAHAFQLDAQLNPAILSVIGR